MVSDRTGLYCQQRNTDMYQKSPLLVLQSDSDASVAMVTDTLTLAGLQVVRSFDLQVARSAHIDCNCPHHGTAQCDCQMVVLLVYDQEKPPVTLVAHSRDGQTLFAVVDSPQQRPNHQVELTIQQALSPEHFVNLNP